MRVIGNNNLKIKQLDTSDCGAACIVSVCAYYGLKIPITIIRQYASTGKNGTSVLGIIEACKKVGLDGKGVMAEPEALHIVNKPFIAHMVILNKYTHFVVVYEVKKDNVTYMDPFDGEFHTISIIEFSKKWSGVLVILEKNENFVSGDKSIHKLPLLQQIISSSKSMMVQALVGAIITTILGVSISFYIGKITDYVLVFGNRNLLNVLSFIMICVIFIQIIISIFRDFLLFSIGQRIDSKLILNYYKHILRLPQTFFDTMRVGEILSRMTDANKIRTFINQTAFGIIINVFTIIIAFGLMLFFSWRLSLIIVAAIPFFMIIFFLYNKLNKTFQRKTMESVADLQSHIVESLNSIQTIKRFGLENFSDTKTEILYVKMMRNIYKNVIGGIFIGCGNSFISSGVTILILWIGSILVIDNNLTPGTLLIFYSLISYVVTPVVALISSNSSIQDAIIAGDRLFQIMNLEQEDSKLSNVELTCDMVGDINFTNVEFRYGAQKNIFTNLNLTIEHAKITAIVGESGSGKTTLASLLQNIYPLNKGKIEIGGFDLTMFTNSSLRRIVSTVPQSVELFMGTLVENIAIGDYSPNIGRVQKLIS